MRTWASARSRCRLPSTRRGRRRSRRRDRNAKRSLGQALLPQVALNELRDLVKRVLRLLDDKGLNLTANQGQTDAEGAVHHALTRRFTRWHDLERALDVHL